MTYPEEVLYAARDCDNLFPGDIRGGALESTVKTVSTIEQALLQAHASLFRFENSDWRWDTRVEDAARAHYQDIDEWALRHGWTWDFDGFDEVVRGLLSFQESDREHGCLCRLPFPLKGFRFSQFDTVDDTRPAFLDPLETRLARLRGGGGGEEE